jgi:hypothetical protein
MRRPAFFSEQHVSIHLDYLNDIPDPQEGSFASLDKWVKERTEAIHRTTFTPEILETFSPVELDEEFEDEYGPAASPIWRKFFLAALLADWVSHETFVERADFARLRYVQTSAYKYTRIWFCRLPDGKVTPVGYTSGYPIAKFVYEALLNDPTGINDRGVFMPLRFVEPQDIRYAYAFNVSIVKELYGTSCSHRLMKAFLRDGARLGNVGVMTITVAEQGEKLSRLLKFTRVGDVTVQGEQESLFVRKPGYPRAF